MRAIGPVAPRCASAATIAHAGADVVDAAVDGEAARRRPSPRRLGHERVADRLATSDASARRSRHADRRRRGTGSRPSASIISSNGSRRGASPRSVARTAGSAQRRAASWGSCSVGTTGPPCRQMRSEPAHRSRSPRAGPGRPSSRRRHCRRARPRASGGAWPRRCRRRRAARRASQCRLVPNTAPADAEDAEAIGPVVELVAQDRPLLRRPAPGGDVGEEAEGAVPEAVARQQHLPVVDGAVEDRACGIELPRLGEREREQRRARRPRAGPSALGARSSGVTSWARPCSYRSAKSWRSSSPSAWWILDPATDPCRAPDQLLGRHRGVDHERARPPPGRRASTPRTGSTSPARARSNRSISASNSAKSPTMSSSLSRRFVAMPSSHDEPVRRAVLEGVPGDRGAGPRRRRWRRRCSARSARCS